MATVDEIADGIYRIHSIVPVPGVAEVFSFNQYLIDDEQPLLFHTGTRRMFPAVVAAIGKVVDVRKLRFVGFSHHEQDEDGSLNELLAAAPQAAPLCSTINAMLNADGMDRPPRALADGETLALGRHVVRWVDAPHVPHGWESGYLMETTTGTLFCGDLFTQPGAGEVAVTESDVLGASEAFRKSGADYYAGGPRLRPALSRMAELRPTLLACMHGSAWRGDGRRLIDALGSCLA